MNPGKAFNCLQKPASWDHPWHRTMAFPSNLSGLCQGQQQELGDTHNVYLSMKCLNRLGRGFLGLFGQAQSFLEFDPVGHWSGEREVSWNVDSVFGFPEKEQFD